MLDRYKQILVVKDAILRGFGGAAGIRSTMTDRGGTATAAKLRTTEEKIQ